MTQGMREQEGAETKAEASDQCGGLIAANTQAQKAREEGSERQLQDQRGVVGNNRAKDETHRQDQESGKRIGGAPGEIHRVRVVDQACMKGILKVRDGVREMPQKPGVLEIV